MKKALVILLSFAACTSSTQNSQSNSTNISESNNQATKSISNVVVQKEPKSVKYEIIRKPNGGSGVFDYMYIVLVHQKINKQQAQWIFDDLINKYGGNKIAIDIWDNKQAFYKELKAYQLEDVAYDAGLSLKAVAKQREIITNQNDKHNVAQYTNTGAEIMTNYPEK